MKQPNKQANKQTKSTVNGRLAGRLSLCLKDTRLKGLQKYKVAEIFSHLIDTCPDHQQSSRRSSSGAFSPFPNLP